MIRVISCFGGSFKKQKRFRELKPNVDVAKVARKIITFGSAELISFKKPEK